MEYPEIKQQHDHLRDEMARLVGILRDAGTRAGVDLVGEARALQAELQKHFETEESEGYLEVVLESRPGWSRRVDRLREQHREILREFGTLVEDEADLVKRFRDALDMVHQHDLEESDLVQQAVIEDLGSGD